MNEDCVIFDIDGTICNTEHRTHWVRSKPRNWPAFAAAIPDDPPYWDMIWLLKLINRTTPVFLCSGREETSRQDTVTWMEKHEVPYHMLFMRKTKDYRDDCIVKREMLDTIRHMGYEPKMVFDDRNKVVNMWRENGLRCLQVQPGDF